MRTRFRHDDLTYGVLLAALIAFAFAMVLDGVHVNDFKGMQVAAATVMAAPSASGVAPTSQLARQER